MEDIFAGVCTLSLKDLTLMTNIRDLTPQTVQSVRPWVIEQLFLKRFSRWSFQTFRSTIAKRLICLKQSPAMLKVLYIYLSRFVLLSFLPSVRSSLWNARRACLKGMLGRRPPTRPQAVTRGGGFRLSLGY